ncbi:DNA (cytosine-5-)-methyltransferase [Mycoplasmopsis felis]|uniref:DNA (cytosine-5-)-methyltransferase n=1 Tax=Mycoplasmopsis felis TaxID=33923 RepID=UPI003A4DB8CE
MELKVIELFAGVGGFRVGLNKIIEIHKTGVAIENKKWDFVWANQYEPSTKTQDAYECYKKRFNTNDISNEDIALIDKNKIPYHSLLVGGFPCQDYSVARSLNNELGIQGKKGILFWEIIEILKIKKTPFVLLENVDRLLKSPSKQKGRDFAIMLKTFDVLGYDVQWRIINAAEYGMPQKRKRVFIFAYKKNLKYSKEIEKHNLNLDSNIFNRVFKIEYKNSLSSINLNEYNDLFDLTNNYNKGKFLETGIMKNGVVFHDNITEISTSKHTLKMVLDKSKEFNSNIQNYLIQDEKLKKFEYLKGSKKIQRTSKDGHKYWYSEGKMSFPDNLNEPARTMLTSEGSINRSTHIIYDETLRNYRSLTPIECELIQMFPPNWTNTMSEKRRYFMMGNALVTGIISEIEPILSQIIENE